MKHAPSNKLLSIVVPVYNIKEHIENCIKSVINQNIALEDYEIIVVDDGSTDGSSEIVKKWGLKTKNIIVHKQANVGLGGARTSGLKIAQGKYIYFLDGDDYLAYNSLGHVLSQALHQNADIIGFGVKRTTELNIFQTDESTTVPTAILMSGIDFIANTPEYRVEVWWYLIKREFLLATGLQFEDKRFVNDSYFTPMLFIRAKSVTYCPIDIYRYVERGDSITKKKSNSHYKKHIADSVYAIEKMHLIIEELKLKENPNIKTIAKIKAKQESYTLFSLIRLAKSDMDTSKLQSLLVRLKELEAYPIKNLKGKEYSSSIYKLLTSLINNRIMLPLFIWGIRGYYKFEKIFRK